jgi:O-antigen ligase
MASAGPVGTVSTRRERGGEWRVLRAVSAAEPRAAVGGTVSRRATFSLVDQESARAAAFLLLHVPVALIAASSRDAATAHAVLTLVVGAWWATASNRTERVAWVAAYIASAEVLWRMTQAQVYWEFGKYAASAIFLLSLMRSRTLKPPLFPLLYFVLLLPSVALTLTGESLDVARDQISFNLSGPFALFLSAWFFSAARFPAFAALRTMFVAFLGPAVAIATLAARGSFSSDVIFSTQSNLAASGGFGPNQVSAALGLGALLALFIVLDSRSRQEMRALMTLALLWLAAQSALTFSRAGLYMAAGGAGLAACFAMRDARLRSRLIPIVLVVAAVGNYFVVPYLEAFTEGAITQRFQDVYLTGRDRMIRADMELFQQNPILGVGPGEARVYRARPPRAHRGRSPYRVFPVGGRTRCARSGRARAAVHGRRAERQTSVERADPRAHRRVDCLEPAVHARRWHAAAGAIAVHRRQLRAVAARRRGRP